MNSLPVVRLAPRRSLWLAGLLLIIHGGALIIVLLLPLPWWGKLSSFMLVGASLYMTLKQHVLLRGTRATVALVWDADGEWTLIDAAGNELAARLLPGSYVTAQLIILNFRLDKWWRRRSVILLGDSLDATSLRHLRVRLLSYKAE